MDAPSPFMLQILRKITAKFARTGRLSGTMKLGSGLGHEEMQALHAFFGVESIRLNHKAEVRLHFERLVQQATEPFWLERIGKATGTPVLYQPRPSLAEQEFRLLERLRLAFPQLAELMDHLELHPEALRGVRAGAEAQITERCFQLARTVLFLRNNTAPVTISELGARYFGSSKALRQGEERAQLLRWLALSRQESPVEDTEHELLASFHVYHDRLTVHAVLFAPVIYSKKGKTFDWIYRLYLQGEAATLNWANLQDIESMRWHPDHTPVPRLICCENEAPFSGLIRDPGGDALLFTSGFPNSAVQKVYGLLAPQAAQCLHWGDSDPNGLRIAAILHTIFPLKLFRCDLPTLKRCHHLLLPLTKRQQEDARALLEQGDFPFAEELRYTLEEGWLEQESLQGLGERTEDSVNCRMK